VLSINLPSEIGRDKEADDFSAQKEPVWACLKKKVKPDSPDNIKNSTVSFVYCSRPGQKKNKNNTLYDIFLERLLTLQERLTS
jgi:hypothetical protein